MAFIISTQSSYKGFERWIDSVFAEKIDMFSPSALKTLTLYGRKSSDVVFGKLPASCYKVFTDKEIMFKAKEN